MNLLTSGIEWTDKHPVLMLVGAATTGLLGACVLRVMA